MDDTPNRGRAAQSRRPAELVSGCRNRLIKHLLSYVTPVFEQTLEELFEAAQTGSTIESRNRLMDAQRVLRNRKTAFTEALNEQLMLGFQRFADGTPIPAGEKTIDPEDAEQLSLVGEQDLEETLAISDMVSKAEIRHTQSIYALNQRFAVLNGGRPVKNDTNPCGPTQIGRALRQCSETLQVEAEFKVRLYRCFDQALQKHIGDCYDAINAFLADGGILPNIRFQAPRPKPGAKAAASKPDAEEQKKPEQGSPNTQSGHSPGTIAVEHGRKIGETDFFSRALQAADEADSNEPTEAGHASAQDLRRMLAQTRSGQASPSGPSAPAPKLHQALSRLQTRMSNVKLDTAGRIGTEEIKRNLREALGKDPETGQDFELPQRDSQTIDILGMLYQHIEHENLLHRPVRKLLQKLQVPMIRAALNEDAFFDDSSHPARQFFNTVADAGELWLEDHPENSTTFGKMESAIEQVLKDYQGDDSVFRDLLEDLDKHIRLLSRKATLAEKRHVEAARGQEKLELAREQAGQLIARLIERYKPPKFVESVLSRPWADFLALIVLRHGDESEQWQQALTVAKTLIFSVRDDLDETVKASLLKRIPSLEKALAKGLAQVGYFERDTDALLANLKACHHWSLQARSEAEKQPQELHQPIASLDPAAPAPARPREKPGKRPKPKLSEAEATMVAKIRLLPFGTWFEFRDPDSEAWWKRKLSWYSPVSGHCLFVNNHGGVAQELDVHELAKSMVAGEIRIYRPSRKPLIDRAMDAIFGKLRKLTGRQTVEAT